MVFFFLRYPLAEIPSPKSVQVKLWWVYALASLDALEVQWSPNRENNYNG